MKKSFVHIAKHSFVYSLGTSAVKVAGIVLIPLYTGYYNLEEFGLLSLFLTINLFGAQLLNLGQSDSLIRLLNDKDLGNNNKSIFFTIASLVVLLLIVSFIVFYVLLGYLSDSISFIQKYYDYLLICLPTISITVFNDLLLNKIRADEKSFLYTSVYILKLIVVIGMSFWFLLVVKSGIEGVLYAHLIAEGITLLLLLYPSLKQMQFVFLKKFIPITLAFGLPLAYSKINSTLLTVGDRFILKWFSGDAELGLYDLAYRVATILSMVITAPLTLSLYPILVKMYKREGDAEYYIKVHKFSSIVTFWCAMGISLIGNEIIRVLVSNTDYYSASSIVPLITLSLAVSTISWLVSMSLILTQNTTKIALIGLAATGINISLNFLFIPIWGMYAAAFNSVLTQSVLYVIYVFYSKKYFEIKFHHSILVKSFVLFVIYCLTGLFLTTENLFVSVFIKFLFFLTFPVWFMFMNIFNREDKDFFTGLLKRLKNPSEILLFIKNNFNR